MATPHCMGHKMTKYITLSRKAKDLRGEVFGKLVALGPVGQRKNSEVLWQCLCDCGTLIIARGGLLSSGIVRSCGCLARESVSARNHRHGMYGTRIYRIWQGMITRCTNCNHDSYEHYGGRGITVCGEWARSFQAFFDHVKHLPNFAGAGYSLDRIDNNGNYEPSNVRWATASEQRRNRRDRQEWGLR